MDHGNQPPPEILALWQRAVESLAKLQRAAAALITERRPGGLLVIASTGAPDSPFAAGQWIPDGSGAFCEAVAESSSPLAVDILDHGGTPDFKPLDGLGYYCGYPLRWPCGGVYGTVCIFDHGEAGAGSQAHLLLRLVQQLIEGDLHLLSEIREHRAANARADTLNRMLQALRGINALAAKTSLQAEFLDEACALIRTHLDLGEAAIIVNLPDGGVRVHDSREDGIQHDFATAVLAGSPPKCLVDCAATTAGQVVVSPERDCADCPLRTEYGGKWRLLGRIEHDGHALGILSLLGRQASVDLVADESLFKDLCAEIGSALQGFAEREAMREAEARESRLLAAIEAAPDSVVLTDPEGAILYANKAFLEVTGYRREEVVGQNPRILKSGEQGPEFYQEFWATLLRGETWSGRIVNRRKDGTRYVETMTTAPVRRPDGGLDGFVAIKRDITAEVEAEQHQARSQRLQSLGILAAGVAHEINNPLSAVRGYGELLQTMGDPDSEVADFAARIVSESDRIASIVRGLLAFAKPAAQDSKPESVAAVLRTAEDLLSHTLFTGRVALEVDPGDAGGCVVDGSGKINQVLVNLLTNARQAFTGYDAPNGNKVVLAAERVDADQVVLLVRDNGPGVPEEHRGKLFAPFFTTKGPGGGTGLGLPVSQRIAEELGGSLEFRPAAGGGAEFRLVLPISRGESGRNDSSLDGDEAP